MADGTAQQCGRVGSCHIYLKPFHPAFFNGFERLFVFITIMGILCPPNHVRKRTHHIISPRLPQFYPYPRLYDHDATRQLPDPPFPYHSHAIRTLVQLLGKRVFFRADRCHVCRSVYRKSSLIIGYIGFLLGTLACGFAPTYGLCLHPGSWQVYLEALSAHRYFQSSLTCLHMKEEDGQWEP